MIVFSNDEIFSVNLPMILDLVVIPGDNNRPRMSSTGDGLKSPVSYNAVKVPSYFFPF